MKYVYDWWIDFPRHVWYFVCCNIFLVMLANIFTAVWGLQRRREFKTIEHAESTKVPRSGKPSLRRFPAALLTGWRILLYRRRIPHVHMYIFEVILTVMYIIVLFIYQHIYINEYPEYRLSLWANQAGFLAASQFPLMTALALKNGAIQILTGVSHEKLNLMHRIVARAMLLLTWFHGWGWVGYEASYIVYEAWIIYGLVAGITFTIVVCVSWAPIRRRFYEWFLIAHNILVLLTLVFTYLHCKPVECGPYIYSCFIVWGFDRACRWGRYVLLSNVFTKNTCRAHLELIDADTIRVTTRRTFPIPLAWKYPSPLPSTAWQAGQHFFLAFPTLGPLESHPMTIGNIPEGTGRDHEIIWIVRTREGLTGRLKKLLDDKGGEADVPMFLDGPYGAPPDITPFETCVFIGGGSGVTYTMSRLRGLLNDIAAGKACTRRIVWIWVVRHHIHLNWLPSELTKALTAVPSTIEFSAQVYVTSPSNPAPVPTSHSTDSPVSPGTGVSSLSGDTVHKKDSSSDTDPEKCSDSCEKHSCDGSTDVVTSFEGVEILTGRPDVGKILEEIVTTCVGPVTVDVSGPDALVASVRRALSSEWASASAVMRGAPTVQLNVEDFTM